MISIPSTSLPPDSLLVERVVALACPKFVCPACGTSRRRVVERNDELDLSQLEETP